MPTYDSDMNRVRGLLDQLDATPSAREQVERIVLGYADCERLDTAAIHGNLEGLVTDITAAIDAAHNRGRHYERRRTMQLIGEVRQGGPSEILDRLVMAIVSEPLNPLSRSATPIND